MTDKPEVISYWYAVDSNADKPYIKKEKGSGLLASFDCAEDAQRFCQWRQDVKYKEVQYVRLTDHEASRAADKARIAELVGLRDQMLNALQGFHNANQARLGLMTKHVYLETQRLPGMRDALYAMDDAQHEATQAIDTALAQQGKEGGV